MTSLAELYKEYPYRGPAFEKHALEKGYSKKEIRKFQSESVVHDQKVPTPKYIPIVSSHSGGFQMDTFINDKGANGLNYLMLININTRKAYAYPMRGKGALQVKSALNKFIKEEPNCHSIASDQDAAYLSDEVTSWMKSHKIIYTTTTDDNHNNLGIINRFMRTIRDLAVNKNLLDADIWKDISKEGELTHKPTRNISPKEMQSLMSAYNESYHTKIKTAPNKMTAKDEQKYILKNKTQTNPYDFKEGDKVRIVEEKTIKNKKRRMVSNQAYTVDSKSGNLFKIAANDRSVNDYPGYKIVKAKGFVPMAKTLKDGKRGNIEEILGYNNANDQYKVKWDDGSQGYTYAKSMREGNPTILSRLERMYWVKTGENIPVKIRKYI